MSGKPIKSKGRALFYERLKEHQKSLGVNGCLAAESNEVDRVPLEDRRDGVETSAVERQKSAKETIPSSVSVNDCDELLENWNPMEEAYNDPNFNSYMEGPGADLPPTHHVNRRSSSKGYVKLYVGNIPRSLSKKAVENMFNHFGKAVVSMLPGTAPAYGKYKGDTTYGFVAFESLREAEDAMSGLNGKEPFNLNIQYAKGPRATPFQHEPETPHDYPPSFWSQPYEKPPNILEGVSPRQFLPERSPGQGETESNSYDQGVFSKYDLPRAVHLHNLSLRSCLVPCEGGKASSVKKRIFGKVRDISREGVEICTSNTEEIIELPADLGECVCCGDIPFSSCAHCGVPYCTKACMEEDSERHRPLCQPRGVDGTDADTSSPKPTRCDARCPESVRYSFLKLDAEPDPVIEPKPRFEHSEIWQLAKTLGILADDGLPLDDDFFVIPPVESAERLFGEGVPQPPSAAELADKIGSFDSEFDKQERDCSIPENVFTEVTIVHREGPGDFWVLTKSGICQLLDYFRALNQRSPRKGSVVSQVGRTFGYHHNGNWYRIVLTKYTPYTGFLVDLGYSIQINPKDLLPLSVELEEAAPLAVRIRLTDDSASKVMNVNDSIAVKAMKKLSNGAVFVKSGHENGIQAVVLPPKGFCCLTAHHTPQAVYVRPLTPIASQIFDVICQDVAAHCLDAGPMKTLPKIGEVVGVRWASDGNFYRSLVTGTHDGKSRVIFLDVGCIEDVPLESLHRIPDSFRKVPATAVKVGLHSVKYPLFNTDARFLLDSFIADNPKLTLEHDGDLSCVKLFYRDVFINEQLNEVLLPSHVTASDVPKDHYSIEDIKWARWEPSVNLEGHVTFVGDYNEISFVCHSPTFDYIREVMTPQVTEHCRSLKMTQYVPRPHEFVLVQHEENWYRAYCEIDVLRPFTARVFFVDFGNTGEVPVEDVRPMAPEFALVPATAKLCCIQGLPPRDSIGDHIETLRSLLAGVNEIVFLGLTKRGPLECKAYLPSLEKPLAEIGINYTRPERFCARKMA